MKTILRKLQSLYYYALYDVSFENVASSSSKNKTYYVHFKPYKVQSFIVYVIKFIPVFFSGGIRYVTDYWQHHDKSFRGAKIDLPKKIKPTKKHLFNL